jgi:hypothetical protein
MKFCPPKKIFSNALTLTVNPLPDDLRIFGDFSIKATVDIIIAGTTIDNSITACTAFNNVITRC